MSRSAASATFSSVQPSASSRSTRCAVSNSSSRFAGDRGFACGAKNWNESRPAFLAARARAMSSSSRLSPLGRSSNKSLSLDPLVCSVADGAREFNSVAAVLSRALTRRCRSGESGSQPRASRSARARVPAIVAAERAESHENLGHLASTADAARIVPRKRVRRPAQGIAISGSFGLREPLGEYACALPEVHGQKRRSTGVHGRGPFGWAHLDVG